MASAQIICIAIDDEPSALRVIENFTQKVEQLNLIKTFRSPIEAITFLNSNKVDLIFLDINMPDLTGIEFIKSLSNPPLIILTTAYSEYALESYDYETVDYLLKPIPFPRFLKAVNKALRLLVQKGDAINRVKTKPIAIKDGGVIYNIDKEQITYLESMGNYVKVHNADRTVVTKCGLQEFLDEHKIEGLYRVHKSYAVNLKKVKKMTYTTITLGNKQIPVGRKYGKKIRQEFGL